MLRILNAEPDNYSLEGKRILSSLGEVVEKRLTQIELREQISEFDVVIVRLGLEIDRAVIEAGHRLRVIVTPTTGLDHIAVPFAEAGGIAILSLKGETEFLNTIPATAEHTWALLLTLMRRIPQAFESVRSGDWKRDSFRGDDLAGRRLGILGLGRIGEKVANYGTSFGMHVAAFSLNRDNWPSFVERCGTLEDLLARSDVLSIHVPLEAKTRHMIGEKELLRLPPGAVIVNTSRGGILDERALIRGLGNGHLSGAALDVIHDERDGNRRYTNPLLDYARENGNLLITPHIGGATVQSMARTEVFMAEKLRCWLQSVGLGPCDDYPVPFKQESSAPVSK